MPKVHGYRGLIMLGFAFVCLGFGTAYAWPGVLNQPVFQGSTTALAALMLPMPIWGTIWYLAGVSLITNAFRVEQSKAMGIVTGLFSIWSLSALNGFIVSVVEGNPNGGWLTSIMYTGIVVVCLGVSRMPNPAKVHKAIVDRPGEAASSSLLGETGEIPLTTKHGDD